MERVLNALGWFALTVLAVLAADGDSVRDNLPHWSLTAIAVGTALLVARKFLVRPPAPKPAQTQQPRPQTSQPQTTRPKS